MSHELAINVYWFEHAHFMLVMPPRFPTVNCTLWHLRSIVIQITPFLLCSWTKDGWRTQWRDKRTNNCIEQLRVLAAQNCGEDKVFERCRAANAWKVSRHKILLNQRKICMGGQEPPLWKKTSTLKQHLYATEPQRMVISNQ